MIYCSGIAKQEGSPHASGITNDFAEEIAVGFEGWVEF